MSLKPHTPTNIVPDSFLNEFDDRTCSTFADSYRHTRALLEENLGAPYYANDRFILYHGSCNDLLELMSRATPIFDLVVTSPPYNIGKEYEKHLEVNEYDDWCTTWMRLLY